MLNLAWCWSLTQLPSLDKLFQLTTLDLSGCKSLTQLPDGLRKLKNLRRLNLSFMKLQNLPDWLPEIAESFSTNLSGDVGKKKATIYLRGTTVEDIPDMSIFDQPYEVVAEFFRNRRLGKSRTLNEIKVVFLGDGEAGKSHTIARLMNDGGEPVDYTDQATPGIVIKHKHYTRNDRTFQVNYWDFGGQEIMHSMHRIFLTGRTMYVVLLNARDDTQADRAHYWLHNIQSFAPGAPVLLVLNKMDQNPNASVDERTLRARYPDLTEIVKLSALKDTREEFNGTFTDVLLDAIEKTGYLDADWPVSWIRVKQELENLKTHYILGPQYRAICDRCEVRDVQTELLHWFNDLGVSFCFCDAEDYALKKHVILRPDWITNGLYIILFNHCPGARNGRLPHRAIYDLLERSAEDKTIHCTTPGARYDQPGDVEYVLGVMRKFQLSLDTGDGHEFIPMLCQQDSKVDFHYYEKDMDTLEFRMDFEYLPDNLLHRLMVERHAELDMDTVWRKGAKFQLDGLKLNAVVVIDGNSLRFFIQDQESMHRSNIYLAILKANVDRIVKHMGLTAPSCKLIYKLDGKQDEFDYEMLKGMQDIGQTLTYSHTWRRMISIDAIFNQSAPAASKEETDLLDAMILACQHLQGNLRYWNWSEDERNTVVRDTLRTKGYLVNDQTRQGLSGSGRGAGELDLDIRILPNQPWTVCEALKVSGYSREWNSHLDKLLNNYNPCSLPVLYLLTYVDCTQTQFGPIWEKYQEHIRNDHPAGFEPVPDSLRTDLFSAWDSTKVARCGYRKGGYSPTVYHIFARIPTENE